MRKNAAKQDSQKSLSWRGQGLVIHRRNSSGRSIRWPQGSDNSRVYRDFHARCLITLTKPISLESVMPHIKSGSRVSSVGMGSWSQQAVQWLTYFSGKFESDRKAISKPTYRAQMHSQIINYQKSVWVHSYDTPRDRNCRVVTRAEREAGRKVCV